MTFDKRDKIILKIIKNSIPPFNSKKKVKFWFLIFNSIIFNGVLKEFDGIKFYRSKKYLGQVYFYNDNGCEEYVLHIRGNLDFKTFLDTLLHEMVHLYQGQIQKNFEFPEPENDITFKVFDSLVKPLGLTTI